MAASREQRIDALRGLAIALVVLGHALSSPHIHAGYAPGRLAYGALWFDASAVWNPLFNLIYTVHMPLFAFVSALFVPFDRVPDARFVWRRFAGLMVPYFVWTAIMSVKAGVTLTALPGVLADAALNPRTPGAAWFLYALFGCHLVYAVVHRLFPSQRALLVLAAVAAVVSAWPRIGASDLLGFKDVLWILPFYLAGVLARRNREGLLGHGRALLALGVPAFALLCAFVWPVEMQSANPWIGRIDALLGGLHWPAMLVMRSGRYAAGTLGALMLYVAYSRLRTGRFRQVQAWLGRRSLGVYVLHGTFLVALIVAGVESAVVLFAVPLLGSAAVTVALEQWRPTRVVLLGQPACVPLCEASHPVADGATP